MKSMTDLWVILIGKPLPYGGESIIDGGKDRIYFLLQEGKNEKENYDLLSDVGFGVRSAVSAGR
ncbi:hypothetical protein FACS1894130_11420 [Spirochaetia bacterium]|nr:hypothetical protein FACS1894130_11420 [Spirochaetia bacterium]